MDFQRHIRRPEDRARYVERFTGCPSQRIVAGYLRDHTRRAESVYVWGFDSLIYLLTDRPAGARYLLFYSLMSDWASDRWQDDFLEKLERN
jgi:hypothetical protein